MNWGCSTCSSCPRCSASANEEDWQLYTATKDKSQMLKGKWTVARMPAPPTLTGGRLARCEWCDEEHGKGMKVDGKSKPTEHRAGCWQMPFRIWVSRVRLIMEKPEAKDPCMHCGTRFEVAKSRELHERYCKRRRESLGLRIGTKERKLERTETTLADTKLSQADILRFTSN